MRGQGLPVWLARFMEAYEKGAQAEAGLQVLSEALALVQQNGEGYYEAEIVSLQGEFLLQLMPHHSEAEHCFLSGA